MKKSKIILFICVIILATQISTAFAEEDTQILNNANEDINNKLKIHYNTNNLSADGGKFSDIRSAVENANDGDTISLSGTYESDGKSINIKKNNLVIKGGASKAILDVKGDDSRAFVINAKNIHLENLIFKNMNSDKFGIVLVNNTNCKIINCEFISNTGNSGGIFINDQAEYTTINNCIFTNNKAKYESEVGGQYGGAIDTHASHTSILNSKFDRNSASDNGGAIYFTRGTDNLVENCEFTNNKAENGGSIYITSTASVQVKNSNFKNNEANNGGAIYNNGNLSSNNCHYNSNKAKSALLVEGPTSVIWSEDATIRVTFEGGNNIINAIWSQNPITLNGESVNPNNKIPSQTINLNIEDKSYSAVTGSDGVAVFIFNTQMFQARNYKCLFSFKNSNDYSDSTNDFDLKITDKIEYKSKLKNKKKIKKKTKKYQAYIPSTKYRDVEFEARYYFVPEGSKTGSLSDFENGIKKIRYFLYNWKNVNKKKIKSKYPWFKARYYYVTKYKATNITSKWLNGKEVDKQINKNYKFNKKSKYKYIQDDKLKDCVLPSVDCESDNKKIIKLSKQIINDKKKELKKKYGKKYKKKSIELTDEEKANAILHWVQKKINYNEYFNTRRGALKTLKDKVGNCADSTHLTVALLRAANIPAKYNAKEIGDKGHVWPVVYFDKKWHHGESTLDIPVDFGKCSKTNKWAKKEAKPGTHIDLYKYSHKYVYRTVKYGFLEGTFWLAVLENHFIDGKWLTYYVGTGNADTTMININLHNVGINNYGVSLK